jgi:acetyl-CoA C-acetyltransferase
MTHDIVIVAAKRTPHGNLLGNLSTLTAPTLASIAHRAAIEQAGIAPEMINEIFTGCVLSAGLGQAPARQAALMAGIPESVGATTINKMCGSGMKTVMLAHDLIKAGSARIVLAGGMESMSRAPYLLLQGRTGYRLGQQKLIDHLTFDGLEDAYEPGQLMGCFADRTAQALNISRDMQDAYATMSMTRALEAQKNGAFHDEIAPVTLMNRGEEIHVTKDEGPDASKLHKLARLKACFTDTGTVTAGNSSSISDGASSLILMTESEAKQHNLIPLARIVGHATHATTPAWFTTAPINAIQTLLTNIHWQADDVDLYEINEAFAVVTLATIQALHLDEARVNVHGGACALGHPIGASGARILTTLLYALKRHHKKRGIAALCIGGGEATAIAIERLS